MHYIDQLIASKNMLKVLSRRESVEKQNQIVKNLLQLSTGSSCHEPPAQSEYFSRSQDLQRDINLGDIQTELLGMELQQQQQNRSA